MCGSPKKRDPELPPRPKTQFTRDHTLTTRCAMATRAYHRVLQSFLSALIQKRIPSGRLGLVSKHHILKSPRGPRKKTCPLSESNRRSSHTTQQRLHTSETPYHLAKRADPLVLKALHIYLLPSWTSFTASPSLSYHIPSWKGMMK